MAERSRVAVLISGRGSNMAALIYASRADDCPYEVAMVSGDSDARARLERSAKLDVIRQAIRGRCLVQRLERRHLFAEAAVVRIRVRQMKKNRVQR